MLSLARYHDYRVKMIVNYKHQGVKDIFNGDDTKYARKVCPQNLWKIARRKLDQLDFAASLNDLRSPPKNRLEALKGDKPTAWLRYAKDNTVFALTTSTEFALSGQTMV